MTEPDPSREDLARWRALRIRRALTRVEFAASQLARELRGERERAWVAGIRDAVDELESEWTLCAPWSSGTRDTLCGALRSFGARWRPVLQETGVELQVDLESAEHLVADPWLVRRAGIALLRVGHLCRSGAGRMRLRARPPAEGLGFGLEMSWDGPATATNPAVSIDALREVCVAGGAYVERGATSVCLWFTTREDARCGAP